MPRLNIPPQRSGRTRRQTQKRASLKTHASRSLVFRTIAGVPGVKRKWTNFSTHSMRSQRGSRQSSLSRHLSARGMLIRLYSSWRELKRSLNHGASLLSLKKKTSSKVTWRFSQLEIEKNASIAFDRNVLALQEKRSHSEEEALHSDSFIYRHKRKKPKRLGSFAPVALCHDQAHLGCKKCLA